MVSLKTPYLVPPAVPQEIRQLVMDVCEAMEHIYDDELSEMVLFGSFARADFHEESDVDILLVLKSDDVSSSLELQKFMEPLTKIEWEHGRYISIKAVSKKKFYESNLMFFRQVKKDGIWLKTQIPQPTI